MSGESSSRPGDVFHPDFHNGHPTYFDISVRSAVHSGVIAHSAVSPGFAALRGEIEKDTRHRGLVEAVGGAYGFFPLVVDNSCLESGLPPALRCSALSLAPPQFVMVCLLVHPSVILWSDCVFNSTGIMLR